MVKVKVYCGLYIGTSHWHGTESYEPDECYYEDVIEVDDDEWLEGTVCIECPACKGELSQSNYHFSLVTRGKPRPDYFHPVDVAILGGDPSL